MTKRETRNYIAALYFRGVITLAAGLCTAMCIALIALPSVMRYYGVYLLLLFLLSLGGSGVLTTVIWAARRDLQRRSEELGRQVELLSGSLKVLEEAADRREEFIASFAHELKTPLTAIIGYADMLRSKEMAPKPRFTAAGYIFSEGRRLEALSLKLMDIIVAGKGDFELRRLDAGYFIREVAAVSVPSTGGDGLTLDIRWDRGEIMIEPDLFKTLLINLVDNARKASKTGQKVELYGKNEEWGYAFYVKDYGRGMKAEELTRITEPFYMVDKSRSREQNSAGLGLALCQRIAELHGTKLEYQSEPDKGTTVRILLPATAAAI